MPALLYCWTCFQEAHLEGQALQAAVAVWLQVMPPLYPSLPSVLHFRLCRLMLVCLTRWYRLATGFLGLKTRPCVHALIRLVTRLVVVGAM